MTFDHAGIGFVSGLPHREVTVYAFGGFPNTPATLYADEGRSAIVRSSFLCDNLGLGSFYADPGLYDVVPTITPPGANYFPVTISVPVNPLDVGGGGGGNGNLVLQSAFDNLVSADAATVVACDGAAHNVGCLIAAPPSWMDNAGNITKPGIYALYCQVARHTADTTPGLFLRMLDQNAPARAIVPLDALATDIFVAVDVCSFVTGDVPTSVTWVIRSSAADITGEVNVTLEVAQLASLA